MKNDVKIYKRICTHIFMDIYYNFEKLYNVNNVNNVDIIEITLPAPNIFIGSRDYQVYY